MAKAMRIKYKRMDYKDLRKKLRNFDATLYNKVCDLWRDAAAHAIKSTILDRVIHVDTGMSAATLIPLAKKVRIDSEIRRLIKSQRNPARSKTNYSRRGITSMSGSYDSNGYRNMKAGEAAARRSSKLLLGSANRPWMIFEFDITVYQYALHENKWKSLTDLFNNFNMYIKLNVTSTLNIKGLVKIMTPTAERGYKKI